MDAGAATCARETKLPKMKIVSWNVNGLRATLRNKRLSLKELLDSFKADVVCMQETKASRSPLDHDIAIADGYSAFFSFCRIKQGYSEFFAGGAFSRESVKRFVCKAYHILWKSRSMPPTRKCLKTGCSEIDSGVVTFCRESATPIAAEEGLTGHDCRGMKDKVDSPAELPELSEQEIRALDSEGRAVLTEHICCGEEQRLVVINVYSPRVDPDSCERLPYKLNFFTALRERCRALECSGRNVLVAGDLNCLLGRLDSAVLQEMPTFPRESETRQLLKRFVSPCYPPSSQDCPDCLLVDSFRHLHPDQKEAYSCWCTKTDSRKLNYGQRIDFILMSPRLVPHLTEGTVHAEVHGSDHCPVSSEFAITLSPASFPPSLCSSYFAEFSGKQSKLSSFFVTKSDPAADNEHLTSKPSPSLLRSDSDQTNDAGRKTKSGSTDGGSASKKSRRSPLTLTSLWNNGHSSVSTSMQGSVLAQPPVRSNTKLSSEWTDIFGGGQKAPLCSGHGEPAVLRTVKKSGPNKDRKFYVCCRPDGAKTDPNARCNFFKWVK